MPSVALATDAPRVTLRSAPAVPYDGAIAAARTCYSPRVIGTAEITDKQRDSIGPLTFEGGHHTVFQHAHFEFGLENISRQFVWSVLHAYPFYNSEQSEPALREAQRAAGVHAAARRRGPARLRAGRAHRVGRLRRALGAAQGRCLGDPEGAALSPADQRARAAQAGGARGREEGDRDGALRHPDWRLHLDGAHRLGPGPAPAAPDAERRRHAPRSADGHRRDGRARQGVRPDVLREGRPRHPARGRAARGRLSAAPGRRRRLRGARSTPGWAAGCRGCATGRRTPRAWSPTPCAPPSGSRPASSTTARRSTG